MAFNMFPLRFVGEIPTSTNGLETYCFNHGLAWIMYKRDFWNLDNVSKIELLFFTKRKKEISEKKLINSVKYLMRRYYWVNSKTLTKIEFVCRGVFLDKNPGLEIFVYK